MKILSRECGSCANKLMKFLRDSVPQFLDTIVLSFNIPNKDSFLMSPLILLRLLLSNENERKPKTTIFKISGNRITSLQDSRGKPANSKGDHQKCYHLIFECLHP